MIVLTQNCREQTNKIAIHEFVGASAPCAPLTPPPVLVIIAHLIIILFITFSFLSFKIYFAIQCNVKIYAKKVTTFPAIVVNLVYRVPVLDKLVYHVKY